MQFNLVLTLHVCFPLTHDGVSEGLFSDIIEGKKNGDFRATRSGGLNTLYLHTDIIKEQFVGGTSAPLLRIINLSRKINNEEYT